MMHGINKIKRVTVVGTGVMGPGIALSFGIGGIEVALVGRTGARLKQSMARIRKSLDRLCSEGLVDDKVAVLDLIKGFVSLREGLHKTELVVEAISEDIELKKSLFSEIDGLCSTDVIFATNTSGLSITEDGFSDFSSREIHRYSFLESTAPHSPSRSCTWIEN